MVPSALGASIAAIMIPRVATTLLVVPGLWVLTRWSLFAPVISREHLGPVAALKRSSELVRNHFELVFLTAAFATVLEEVAIHAGAVVGLLVSGSDTWGAVARRFDRHLTVHAVGRLRDLGSVYVPSDTREVA